MRKLILILTLLVFSISCAVAEGVEPATTDMPTITMIGGADGPTDITISEASDAEESTTIGIIGGVDGPTVMIGGADGPTEINITELAEELIPLLLNECAAQLHELSGDSVLLNAMTTNEDIRQIVAIFHEDSQNGIVSWHQVTNIDLLLSTFGEEMDGLSDAAQEYLNQRVFSASYLSAVLSSMHGVNAVAATSLLNISQPFTMDLPTAMYIAKCENDTGMAMGIWNNGDGIVLVTASFVPNISSFEENNSLAGLFR